jgi:hypothetical protein
MRLIGAAVLCGLSLVCAMPTLSFAQPAPTASKSFLVRYMGEVSCETWLAAPDKAELPRDAVLNWVLGYLSRAAVARGVDLLRPADQEAIVDWLDSYCTRQPRSTVLTGASMLEREMVAGEGPKSAQLDWPLIGR